MIEVAIIFRNPAGCVHREVINVKDSKNAKDDPHVVRRIKELQRELDCEIIEVIVEREKEGKK